MRKVLIFLVVLMMIFSMSACSSNETEKEILTENNQENVQEDIKQKDNEDELNSTEDYTSDQEDVPLPEGYPDDLVPIIEGAKVDSGYKQVQDGKEEVFVRLLSDKNKDKIFAFYKKALSEKAAIDESDFAGILTIECDVEDKNIKLDVLDTNQYEGYFSLIRITIVGEPSSDETNNEVIDDSLLDSANSNLIDKDKIPEGYPLDLAPIYGGSTIFDAGTIEMETEKFYITAYSNDKNEKVISFYKNIFNNIENKQEGNIDTGMYQIGGDIDGKHILVTIGNDKENSGFESSISITVDK